jgi:hypothetical protein
MKSGFHDVTLVAIVRNYVNAWRKREGWSRESVVDVIVDTHNKAGANKLTGITFSESDDAFNRQYVNGQKVYRWLDDESKDNNLLPSNFLPSILAALPADLRLRCVSDLLMPLGIEVAVKETACATVINFAPHLMTNQKESFEAQQAMVALMDGEISDADLERARVELLDQESAAHRSRESVEAEQARRRLVSGAARG